MKNTKNEKFLILEKNIIKDKNIQIELFLTLTASAICASVGLLLNSITLIVGAKLLAPFIRPAQGFGFSIAIKNRRLAFKFFKQFTIFFLMSLFISIIFFKINNVPNNIQFLLNKTHFSYFDILVGIFCGIAGIIGKSRIHSDNILYGVAVAASLMPSVCTMGYAFSYNLLNIFFNSLFIFLTHISLISIFAFLGTLIYMKKG